MSLHAWTLAALPLAHRISEMGTPGRWHAEGVYRLRKGCICLSCDEPTPWAWTLAEVDGPDDACYTPVHVSEADARLIAASVNAMRVALPLIAETLERHAPPVGFEPCCDWCQGSGHCPDFRAAAAMLFAFVQHHPDCPPGYEEAAR